MGNEVTGLSISDLPQRKDTELSKASGMAPSQSRWLSIVLWREADSLHNTLIRVTHVIRSSHE